MRSRLVIAWMASLLLGGFGILGCGGDEGDKCVATVCDPALHQTGCWGNSVQACAADGKAFVYTACGRQQRCDAASGRCVARTCTTLGEATCATVTEVERCRDDGSGFDRIPCASGVICRDGRCVPSSCTSDPDRCTTHGLVTCENASWVQQNCPVSEICVESETGFARCQPTVCTPEERRCVGSEVRVCGPRGAVETTIACAEDEVCVNGFCQAEVCGSDGVGPDVAEVSDVTDVSDTEPEPESRIVFTLNGVAETFNISAFAIFDAGDRQVTVKASKSTRAIELRFNPANQTVQGTFSSEVFNPVKVLICYDDGGQPADFLDCEGFSHRSVAYDVVVTVNDGEGGRFEATFEATLEDVNTDTTRLSAGQINVKYR